MPLWLWHSITLRVVALVDSNQASCQIVSSTFANKSLVLIKAINDNWWQLVYAVSFINEIKSFVEDRVEVVIDGLCLLRVV